MLTIATCNGRTFEISGEHAMEAASSKIFIEWVHRLESCFTIHEIEFQSVDFARNDPTRIFFIKFKANITSESLAPVLHGIVFLRGGAVSIMPVLRCIEDGNLYTVLTNQPRPATGRRWFPEVPAGMLDESGNFAGVAARELEEELGFIIDPKELVDLGAVFDRPWPGMFPSPGACEEFIRLFFFERDITRAELEKFRGRQTGLREEGEFIMLSVIRLEDLPRTTPDGKSLASFGLYLARYLKSKGRPLFGSD